MLQRRDADDYIKSFVWSVVNHIQINNAVSPFVLVYHPVLEWTIVIDDIPDFQAHAFVSGNEIESDWNFHSTFIRVSSVVPMAQIIKLATSIRKVNVTQ